MKKRWILIGLFILFVLSLLALWVALDSYMVIIG